MSIEQKASDNEQPTQQAPLLLEAPQGGSDAQKLDLESGQTLRFDALGPMVVNSNGVRIQQSLSRLSALTHAVLDRRQTLSRISNWTEMTDTERARTLRVLLKRNQYAPIEFPLLTLL